jgi:hypothetical protein
MSRWACAYMRGIARAESPRPRRPWLPSGTQFDQPVFFDQRGPPAALAPPGARSPVWIAPLGFFFCDLEPVCRTAVRRPAQFLPAPPLAAPRSESPVPQWPGFFVCCRLRLTPFFYVELAGSRGSPSTPPAHQTKSAEAAGKERQGCGQWDSAIYV